MFITQQVGAENDRDLVEMVLPHAGKPFPNCTLRKQRKALEDAGIATAEAGITRRPDNVVEIKEANIASQLLRLVDKLEELEDVQSVHHNAEIDEEILESLDA